MVKQYTKTIRGVTIDILVMKSGTIMAAIRPKHLYVSSKGNERETVNKLIKQLLKKMGA